MNFFPEKSVQSLSECLGELYFYNIIININIISLLILDYIIIFYTFLISEKCSQREVSMADCFHGNYLGKFPEMFKNSSSNKLSLPRTFQKCSLLHLGSDLNLGVPLIHSSLIRYKFQLISNQLI